MASEPTARFSFGPRDRRGLIAGIRTGQLVLLASSLLLGVLLIRHGGKVPLAFALAVTLSGGAAGWLPIAGRTSEEWLPVVVRYLAGSAARRPVASPTPRAAPACRRAAAQLYRPLELVETPGENGRMLGVVFDRKAGTASAALAFGAGCFALLDEGERLQRVAAWSGILASCADSANGIHRLQWLERLVPSARPPDALPPLPPAAEGCLDAPGEEALLGARRSYEALLRSERGRLVHELLLVASVRTGRAGRDFPEVAGRRLAGELASLERRCAAAGLNCERALSAELLGACLRRAGEPRPAAGLGCGSPWPELTEERWSAVRAGALWHTTYWISEWPRHEVASDFLLPVLLEGDTRRTLSLVMAPIAPIRAVRAAEQARTAKAADAELRVRHGFALTARSRREEEAVLRREAELAAGHAGYRFSGYLAVSATSAAGLVDARRRLEQSAALARLELVRLDGQQAQAFLTTLPVGRGCG